MQNCNMESSFVHFYSSLQSTLANKRTKRDILEREEEETNKHKEREKKKLQRERG